MQLSPLQDWEPVARLISITERAAAYEEWARTRLRDFGERVQQPAACWARWCPGVDYVQAVRRRRELRAELQAAMAGLDVVLTAAKPPRRRRSTKCRHGICSQAPSFTMPFNVAGYPAISVCSGFGAGELPVAIQLVGKPFRRRPSCASPMRSKRRRRSATRGPSLPETGSPAAV